TKLTLTWTDNSYGISGSVEIQRRTAATTYQMIANVSAGGQSYVDFGLDADTLYTYRVRVHRRGHSSAYSDEASGHTLTLAIASVSVYPETLVGGLPCTATVSMPVLVPEGG